MDRLANVATPFTAFTAVVPASVADPAFNSATCTAPVKPVTVLPNASRASTATAGEITTPAKVVPGCDRNTSAAAAAGVMLKALLVAGTSDPELALSVYPVPARLMDRVEKLATPPAAATVSVPESVPP